MKKYILCILASLTVFSAYADIDAVGCKGKISPDGTVYRVSAASPTAGATLLGKLCVKKGDFVKEGQVIAQLTGTDKALLTLKSSAAELERAKSLSALNILRQRQNLEDLKGNFEQNKDVLEKKDPPRREKEQLEFEQTTLKRHIAFAGEMLKAVIANENANVAAATAAHEEAKALYNEYFITSPIAGVVVETYSKAGEMVASEGICEIADTSAMYVDAEVYESDVEKIKVGLAAQCKSDARNGKTLSGKVVEISQYVKNNNLFSSDPSDFTNSRVVPVKIKLDNPQEAKSLIGSQVDVRILLK